MLRCRPWKLKGLFAILTSKTTKKGLHSQYLYTLRVPDGRLHKVLIYIEHHSVCPLVGIGTPPPLAASECALPPPGPKGGGGGTLACG
jgi:hypothetical protein